MPSCQAIYYTKPGRERFQLSPARHIEEFPANPEMHEPFTDVKAITDKDDLQLLLFIYFVHYTFARPAKEVRLLKVKDLRERSIVVRAKYSKTDITKTPTMPKPLEQLIDQLGIRNNNPDYYLFGKGDKPGPLPISVNVFYSRHRNILESLKITGKHTLYSWKHMGNIKLFRADVNLKAIQLQNGHSNLRTI